MMDGPVGVMMPGAIVNVSGLAPTGCIETAVASTNVVTTETNLEILTML
jgi:hypothetical protein